MTPRVLALAAVLLLIGPTTARPQYLIPIGVVSTAGGNSAGIEHRVIDTLGQAVIGLGYGQSHSSQAGFWYQPDWVTTGANDSPDTALRYAFGRNRPNPFNPVTLLAFSIPEDSDVSIRIYDVSGRAVMTLVDEYTPAGVHELVIDGSHLPSGVYFCRMAAGSFSEVRKLVLAK